MKSVAKTTALISLSLLFSARILAQEADIVLYNGKVLAVDNQFSVAEAVGIRASRIIAVGENDEILGRAGSRTLKIDLNGRTVIPGLIDTHSHVHDYAVDHYGSQLGHAGLHEYPIDWRDVKAKDDVLKQIASHMEQFRFKPGEWIYFSAANLGMMGYGPEPAAVKILFDELTRWDLDKVTPKNPVVVSIGVPMSNGFYVNSKALDIFLEKYKGYLEQYGRAWKTTDGRLTGLLEPPASSLLAYEFLPRARAENVAPIYKKELEEWSAMGVTTISTVMPTHDVEAYNILERQDGLKMRLAWGHHDFFGVPDLDALFRKMGNLVGTGSEKLWMVSVTTKNVDGAGVQATTDLKRKKEWQPGGKWWPIGQDFLTAEYRGARRSYHKDWFLNLRRNNLRLANMHVAGDRSVRLLFDIFEEIDKEMPLAGQRWSVDHCSLVNPKDIPRAAKLGVIWSCAPKYIESVAPVAEQVYGDEIAQKWVVPVKSMLDSGVRVVFEMDRHAYIWRDLEMLLTRKVRGGKVYGGHEGIDRATALKMITRWAAGYVLREDRLGSLEPGKLADLVVLDRDYMTIPDDEISDVRVLMTMLGGEVVYVNPRFREALNPAPTGAVISTYEELVARR